MATSTVPTAARRTRITVDVSPELRREVRVAAARRDENITRYVTKVLEQSLAEEDAVRGETKK